MLYGYGLTVLHGNRMTLMTTSRTSRGLPTVVLFGMLDCFVFASGPFVPEGTRKPGEKSDASEVAAEGRWAFQPPRDEFSHQALLDLRSLNEKFAGEHGFITRSKDGNDFALADGKPMRFWAVNDGAFDKDLPRHARFLAKRGINMVRFHSNITPTGSESDEYRPS